MIRDEAQRIALRRPPSLRCATISVSVIWSCSRLKDISLGAIQYHETNIALIDPKATQMVDKPYRYAMPLRPNRTHADAALDE